MVVPVPLLRRLLGTLVHRTLVVVGGLVLTLLVFLVLPVMETIGKPPTADLTLQSIDTAELPPPPDVPLPEPEQKPPEPEDKPPDLQEPAQPLDLAQLEVALNPGLGGEALAGDFAPVKLTTATAANGGNDGNEALFSLADLDQKPRVIHQPSPVLSPEARRKVPGTVHILFLVGTDGRVESPIVQKSTDPIFDQPALAAIKQWKFEPGKRNGQPVRFRMRVPITFPEG